jgi:hypothetical protein
MAGYPIFGRYGGGVGATPQRRDKRGEKQGNLNRRSRKWARACTHGIDYENEDEEAAFNRIFKHVLRRFKEYGGRDSPLPGSNA